MLHVVATKIEEKILCLLKSDFFFRLNNLFISCFVHLHRFKMLEIITKIK